MVVTASLVAYRYDHDGNPVSATALRASSGRTVAREARVPSEFSPAAPLLPGYGLSFAAIDPFGIIAVSRLGDPNLGGSLTFRGDIVTDRFDGLTGKSLWGNAAVYDAGTNRPDYPTGIFLDRDGDVLVTGLSSLGGSLEHVTLKYARLDGSVLWGPSRIDSVSSPGTAALTGTGDLWVSVRNGGLFTLLYSGDNGSVRFGPVTAEETGFQNPRTSVIDPGGAFLVAGDWDGQPFVIKYDLFPYPGGVVWGPLFYEPPPGTDAASIRSVAVDGFGHLFVAALAFEGSQPLALAISQLSGDGSLRWGPLTTSGAAADASLGLAAAGNGDAILSGVVLNGSTPSVGFWRYRGSDGSLAWGPSIVGATLDEAFAAFPPYTSLVASNGRVFASQRIDDGTSVTTQVFELDGSSGVPAWGPTPITALPIQGGQLQDLAGGADGTIAVVGNDAAGSMVTYKYARTDGALLWGPSVLPSSSGWQAQIDGSGDVIVLASGVPPLAGLFVIKYSGADGSTLWGPVLVAEYGNPTRLALDAAGNAVVLFWTTSADGTSFDAGVAKLTGATGAVSWGPVLYNSAAGQDDFSRALALTPTGDVFVVGDTWDLNGVIHWFALKYAGADGALIWGPAPPFDGQPFAAACDAAGDLIVTGTGITTAKYGGGAGAVLWSSVSAPVGSFAEGRAIGVDASGDVAVLGTLDGNLATVRYRGSDGVKLWGPVLFDGEAGSFDIAYDLGLAFDGSGNVVVGGYSRRLSRNYDMVTLKYEAASGATLWGPIYVGSPDAERMTGFSVVGDSVVVGGSSQSGLLVVGMDEDLGIATLPPDPAPASCGEVYAFDFEAANGTTPYVWTIASGSLPPGLLLSPTGILSGQPAEQGVFAFSVQVEDAASQIVTRDFEIVVGEGPGPRGIDRTFETCPPFTLSLPGPWTSHLWLPSGETTTTISVFPLEMTTYGLVVTDPSGCVEHHSITIAGTVLQDPSCLGPAISSVSPGNGPAAGGTALTLTGMNFQAGATVTIGGAAASDVVVVDPTQITATAPALIAGSFNDVSVVNPDTGNAALLDGFYADFDDVPATDPFWAYIATLVDNGITAGCGGGNYCPADPVTRAQMAVFLLRSLYGSTYEPPPGIGYFNDVPGNDPFAPWIDQLYVLGITDGCGNGNYCPSAPVTRAQMAAFLLKTRNGSAYIPPAAVGIFGDVPASDPFASWIEQIYNQGITGGCNASPLLYCPGASVTRGQMAVFLVKTFGLQ